MPSVLTLWNRTRRLPMGERVFSFAFARRAPYFASIRPRFVDIRLDRSELVIPDRRWIPKGMEVAYTAKARGDITCIAETDREQWLSGEPDLPVRVRGVDREGTVVVEDEIRLWVTDRT